jgi:hypothetical protein
MLQKSDPGSSKRKLCPIDCRCDRELIGRLIALAQAHSLLAEAAWHGAPLAEIIRLVLPA